MLRNCVLRTLETLTQQINQMSQICYVGIKFDICIVMNEMSQKVRKVSTGMQSTKSKVKKETVDNY